MHKKPNPLIKSVTFRVFTALVLLLTSILYVIILGLSYLQYTGGIDVIYTESVTNLLIGIIIVLFVIGWFFSYTLYVGIIKPIYETLNIIAETISNLIAKDSIDKEQVMYLNEFVDNSLSQLNKSSLTNKMNLSLSTESYLNKLSELMRQNQELVDSKQELADLVKQLENQQKLLELERAKTNAIIDSLPNGLLVTSKDGNVFLANRELENILDLKANDILGKFIYNILPDIEFNSAEEKYNKDIFNINPTHKYTSIFNYQTSNKKKNIILENTSNPIMLNNNILGSVYILRDTTQERSTERAQKEFVSLASHQLRTPITSIKWNAEIILSNNSIDSDVRMAVNDIYKEGTRMEKLVSSLLNLSRIDLGTIKLSTQEIYLDKYIESLAKTLQSEMEVNNLTFETNILLKTSITNDPVYLDIIIVNILHNAIKYSNPNSVIQFKAEIIPETEKILITISDTGIGIPKSQHSQIFSRLFRADNAKI
ncbi:MAG: histidine kinase dimerization/phospho-acceptor domain-containing protein, partial [Candidatus Paceibacterota bacterium]